jgi:hypothetical protein
MKAHDNGSGPDAAISACWRTQNLFADHVRRHGKPVRRNCLLHIGDQPGVYLNSLASPAGDG